MYFRKEDYTRNKSISNNQTKQEHRKNQGIPAIDTKCCTKLNNKRKLTYPYTGCQEAFPH